jgi:hypothetical protein
VQHQTNASQTLASTGYVQTQKVLLDTRALVMWVGKELTAIEISMNVNSHLVKTLVNATTFLEPTDVSATGDGKEGIVKQQQTLVAKALVTTTSHANTF